MTKLSHVERLAQAGVLDPQHLSEEHREVINQQFTDHEVDAIISSGQKLKGAAPGTPPKTWGFIV
jgi:hypothetical protein